MPIHIAFYWYLSDDYKLIWNTGIKYTYFNFLVRYTKIKKNSAASRPTTSTFVKFVDDHIKS